MIVKKIKMVQFLIKLLHGFLFLCIMKKKSKNGDWVIGMSEKKHLLRMSESTGIRLLHNAEGFEHIHSRAEFVSARGAARSGLRIAVFMIWAPAELKYLAASMTRKKAPGRIITVLKSVKFPIAENGMLPAAESFCATPAITSF